MAEDSLVDNSDEPWPGPAPAEPRIKRYFNRITIIINLKAVVVSALAIASMLVCSRFSLTADFPLTLIATAIVFPIVFSIGGAYKRREVALDDYGTIKAHGRAIFFAARDWLEEPDPATLQRSKIILGDLLKNCRALFHAPVAEMPVHESAIYRNFSELSGFIKELRGKGLASGEVSRCNQYLSKMIVSFESIKHIYQYRTPVTLRAYSDIFILVLPILYGPFFAASAKDYAAGLGYLMPVLFSVILVGLDNIQAHLENPFDQIGEDDIVINAEKFVARLDL
jgi:predicted membrane chloride channel (bestrophin family)